MVRNEKIIEKKEEVFLSSSILATKHEWQVFDEVKNSWLDKKAIMCSVNRINSKNKSLYLGECNDGSKFTSVNQAINQAKQFISTCNQYGW